MRRRPWNVQTPARVSTDSRLHAVDANGRWHTRQRFPWKRAEDELPRRGRGVDLGEKNEATAANEEDCKSVDEPPPVGLVEDRKGLAAVPIRPVRDARLDVDPRDESHRREVFDQVGCAPMPVSSNEPEMHLANSHS